MQMHWILDRPSPDYARLVIHNDGQVDFDMAATDLDQQELMRIAQHLLQAAGHSDVEVIAALNTLRS